MSEEANRLTGQARALTEVIAECEKLTAKGCGTITTLNYAFRAGQKFEAEYTAAIRGKVEELVNECESLIYHTRYSVDTGDLEAKLNALKAQLEGRE